MIKRAFDLLVCIIFLPLFTFLICLISFVLLFYVRSAILFTQKRVGLNGGVFTLYKFRTMNNKSIDGKLLPDGKRIFPFGRFLRSTSLDELPSIINILKGEMSWVGPRPLPEKYRHRYTQMQFRRHEVLPGVTGLAQVNGRNAISWNDKFLLDVHYVDHNSFLLDLKILIKTVFVVLQRKDISASNHSTMPEFLGDSQSHEK